MLGILAGTAFGIGLGTASGLTPGVHANTMAGLLLAVQGLLLPLFGLETVAVAMFAALVTHTFLDIIPSTFLGIPDPDTALSVLPAHALCLSGKGEEAVRVSALGSAYASLIALPLSFVFILLLPSVQPYIDWGIGLVLLLAGGLLIVYSDSPSWSLAVFLVSGALGVFSFHYAFLGWHTAGMSSVLMPLLSGLFGISVLLSASDGTIPEQHWDGHSQSMRTLVRHTGIGAVAGACVGWLPGLSNATANAVLQAAVSADHDPRGYIVATSAANTANAFLSLAALFALSRMRNGVMTALASQDLPGIDVLLLGGTVAALCAYLLTVRLSRFARKFNGVPVRRLSIAVIALIVALTVILCGPFGLCILALATAVGSVPPLANVRRVACMGAVMIPVMLFSFGIPV
jgi:putative membrane protein